MPGMARIAALPDAHCITLLVDGVDPLHVPLPDTPAEVLVWCDRAQAQGAGPDAAAWLSEALGCPCCLVHIGDAAAARGVDPTYAKPDDRVSFADAFPVLVVNAASLDDLNARLRGNPYLLLRDRLRRQCIRVAWQGPGQLGPQVSERSVPRSRPP